MSLLLEPYLILAIALASFALGLACGMVFCTRVQTEFARAEMIRIKSLD